MSCHRRSTTTVKIALLGPSAPYRGGIAHHNNMLVRSLRARGHEVDMITFNRQYPAFLYPGAFQEEGGEEFSDIGAERLLDSMNPLSWRGVARELAGREYDLHINRFWIPLFGWMFGTIAARLEREGSCGPTITLVDNLHPHEARPGDRLLTGRHFRYCKGAITQSGTVSTQFQQAFPTIPEIMVPHPVYENFGRQLEKREARSRVDIGDGPVILFFGFVRKYKGLDHLLRAMKRTIALVPGIRLLVVGEYFDDPEEYRQIMREEQIEESVTVVDRYVPNEEVAQWFSAADLLVLPYRSATNSGIVQIGYNFALPAVVTDVGSLSEVVLHDETGIVVPDPQPDTLANAIAFAFEGDRLARLREGIKVERKKYSWEEFARRVEEFAVQAIER